MIGGFNDIMARSGAGGMTSIDRVRQLYGGGDLHGLVPQLGESGGATGPATLSGAPVSATVPTAPAGLTPEQELLNKGPKAVWDDWIQRMGGFLAATPRETPQFGPWNYKFTAQTTGPRPGTDPWGGSRQGSLEEFRNARGEGFGSSGMLGGGGMRGGFRNMAFM